MRPVTPPVPLGSSTCSARTSPSTILRHRPPVYLISGHPLVAVHRFSPRYSLHGEKANARRGAGAHKGHGFVHSCTTTPPPLDNLGSGDGGARSVPRSEQPGRRLAVGPAPSVQSRDWSSGIRDRLRVALGGAGRVYPAAKLIANWYVLWGRCSMYTHGCHGAFRSCLVCVCPHAYKRAVDYRHTRTASACRHKPATPSAAVRAWAAEPCRCMSEKKHTHTPCAVPRKPYLVTPDPRCVNRCALSRSHDPVGARAREPYPDTPYGFKAVAYGMARTAPGVAVGVGPS